MYKLIYSGDKRFIIFKSENQLARFLNSVDVKRRDFRLYKKGSK